MRSLFYTLTALLVCVVPPYLSSQCDGYILQYPAGDICANAPLLCLGQLDGLCGNTGDYTPGVNTLPPPWCGTIENDAWLSFIAPSETIDLQLVAQNCEGTPSGTGVQMVIYDVIGCNEFIEMSNCFSDGMLLSGIVSATNLTPGAIYYALIDGWAGDVCDYEITVLSGLGSTSTIPAIIASSNTACPNQNTTVCDQVCAYTSVTYEAQYIGDALWEVHGADQWTYSGNTLNVNWGSPGLGLIKMSSIDTTCGVQNEICVEILELPVADFKSIPSAINNTIKICKGQPIFLENLSLNAQEYYWDFGNTETSNLLNPEYTYQFPGTYELQLITNTGCFCADTSTVMVQVSDSESPEIECVSSICPGDRATYTTAANCSEYHWSLSSNGTILDGGGLQDDFVTIEWEGGLGGAVELSVSGCAGDYCQLPIIVSIPLLTDNTPINGPDKVCKNEIAIYNIPDFDGTEIVWAVSPVGSILEGQGTNQIKVEWDGPVSNLNPQWVSVNFDNCYLGCGGDGFKQVFILDEYYISGEIEFCENSTQQFQTHPAYGTEEVSANWTLYAPNGTVAWQSNMPSTQINLDWSFGFGRFRLVAEPANPATLCSEIYTLLINVIEQPELVTAIEGEQYICPGKWYTYNAQSEGDDVSYDWIVTNGNAVDSLKGKTINIQWGDSPPYELAVKAKIIDGALCISAPYEKTIQTVSDLGFQITGSSIACIDQVEFYSAFKFENTNYEWIIFPPDAGSIVSGTNENVIEVQWNKAGTAILQLVVCNEAYTYNVIVQDYLNPQVIHPAGLCEGQPTTVHTLDDYESYVWIAEGWVVANGPVAQLTSGHYQVSVTNINGCTGTQNFYIDEFPEPDISISTGLYLGLCEDGPEATIQALETTGGFTYEWYQDGFAVGGNVPTYSTNEPGEYHVVVMDQNGCLAGSNTVELNACEDLGGFCDQNNICVISPIITAGCTFDGDAGFYPQQTANCLFLNFVNTSTGFVPNSFSWNFGDPASGNDNFSNLENPSHQFSGPGIYTVELVLYFPSTNLPGQNCGVRLVQDVEIYLEADFEVQSGCPGGETQFFDLSNYLPASYITNWQWDFGDPVSGGLNFSNAANPVHYYDNPGLYDVSLTVTDLSGCQHAITKPIQVLEAPIVAFSAPQGACVDEAIPFHSNVIGDQNGLTYQWDFGDPSSGSANTSKAEDPYHIFSNPGGYTVSLTVTDIKDCQTTFSQTINVQSNNLVGTILNLGSSTICEGDSTLLWASGAFQYNWSTGEQTQFIVIKEAGIYDLTISDAFGCTKELDPVVIDVIPQPDDEIRVVEYDEYGQPINYHYNNYSLCEGEDLFIETLGQTGHFYLWSTGQIGNQISFINDHQSTLTAGTYTFHVNVTNSENDCTNYVGPLNIIVNPRPSDIQIESFPATPVCAFQSIHLFVSNPNPDYNYVWNTGETGTDIHVFFSGKYSVTAYNQFGCQAESNEIEVLPGPNTWNIPSGCFTRCNPDTICIPEMPSIEFYQWYYNGSPIQSTDGNLPNYIATQSGEYYLEMMDTSGCMTTSDPLYLDLYPGFGSITGNVYFDVNDNGQIDTADTLYTGIPIILSENGNLLDTTISGFGDFGFWDIISNTYEVSIDSTALPLGITPIIQIVETDLQGCDAENVVNFLLKDCPITYGNIVLETCEGDTLMYENHSIPAGETIDIQLNNAEGCDSILTVFVNPLPIYQQNIELETCAGTTIEYNGQDLPPGSETTHHFQTIHGCDSIIHVSVLELPVYSENLEIVGCDGDTISYNGQPLIVGSQTAFVFESVEGCDSTVIVNVIPFELSYTFEELEACKDEDAVYNGINLPIGTSQEFIFIDQNGCDSTVLVTVLAYPEVLFELGASPYCENGEQGVLQIINPTGGQSPYEFSIDGSNFQADPVFDQLVSGNFTVWLQDDYDCQYQNTIEIAHIPAIDIFLEDQTFPCGETSITLSPQFLNGITDQFSWQWADGTTNPVLEIYSGGTYYLEAQNECEIQTFDATITHEVDLRDSWFYIPNSFSPNGDGINDEWRAYPAPDIEILHYELHVFDRWGNYLFETGNVEDGWNGLMRDEPNGTAVYVYFLKSKILACGEEVEVFIEGDLVLIR